MTAAPQYRSELLRTLQARGYIHQTTHPKELDEAAGKGVVTGYIGFDSTAPSLHVGSMVQIMTLRRLQQAGHKPIVLMGGGTTKVGDPSGKDESRKLLVDAEIAANIAVDPEGLRKLPDLRRRADRRDDGRQCRVAGQAGLGRRSCAKSAGTSPSTAC